MNRDFFFKLCVTQIYECRILCGVNVKSGVKSGSPRGASLSCDAGQLSFQRRRGGKKLSGREKGRGGVERHCDSMSERKRGRESDIRGSIPSPAVEYLDVFIAALLHFYFVIGETGDSCNVGQL